MISALCFTQWTSPNVMVCMWQELEYFAVSGSRSHLWVLSIDPRSTISLFPFTLTDFSIVKCYLANCTTRSQYRENCTISKLLSCKLHNGKPLPCILHDKTFLSCKLHGSKALFCTLHDKKFLSCKLHDKKLITSILQIS